MYDKYKNNKVFGGLDGLRFFSIFAVFWHHTPFRTGFLSAESYGFLGVDLFFVISGFLIVTLLLRESDLTGGISLKSFYMRRSLRIFPLYYGFLFALALMYFVFNRESNFAVRYFSELPIYLLYLANLTPVGLGILWSLASEEQFYLIWPFFEKYFKKYIFYILSIGIAINQIINFQLDKVAEWLDMPYLKELSIMQTTFTPILLGVALAHILHHKKSFNYIKNLLNSYYSALLWLVILIVLCSNLPEDISGFPRLLIQTIMLLLVGSVVINENNVLAPLLKFSLLARIGAISYGVYLFHIHAIVIVEKILARVGFEDEFTLFILAYALSILAAELSYRFYETPFLRLKAKFSAVHQNHA